MDGRIKSAVIGLSSWAQEMHLDSLPNYDNLELVSVCSQNLAKNDNINYARYGIHNYDNYEDMLIKEKPDIVFVLAPNHCHYEMTKFALENNIHVICEKPFTTSYTQAKKLDVLATRRRMKNLVFFTQRGLHSQKRLKEALDNELIGHIRSIRLELLSNSWFDLSRETNWKMSKVSSGGGVLMDYGFHLIDLVHWYLGRFDSVIGVKHTFIKNRKSSPYGKLRKVETEDDFFLKGTLINGSNVMIYCSRVFPGKKNFQRIEILGSKGAIIFQSENVNRNSGFIELFENNKVSILNQSKNKSIKFSLIHKELVSPFLISLNNSKTINEYPTFKNAVDVHAVVKAAYSSSKNERKVKVRYA